MRSNRVVFFLVSVLLAVLWLDDQALAQPQAMLDRYRASETPEDFFHTSRPTDLSHLHVGAQLHFDYAWNPLVYETVLGDPSSEAFAVVRHQLMATLGLSLGLVDRVVVFAGMPVALVLRGANDPVLGALGVAPAEGPGLSDAYLGARVRILGDDPGLYTLGAQATLTLPTSGVPNTSYYRGDPSLTVHPELLFELRPGWSTRLTANAGVRVRRSSAASMSNLEFGPELTYALAASRPVWQDGTEARTRIEAVLQVYGDLSFATLGMPGGAALEALLGAKLLHRSGLVVGASAGLGLLRGFGSPDLRLVAMGGWRTPEEKGAVAAMAPLDSDADGLLDPVDRCPDLPEDRDGSEDDDGCPDPDNDGDGVLDGADDCPNEAETVNEWKDEDGCPDTVPDTDGDGVLDSVDRCPSDPEDKDGHQDEDGCPDTDNDGDGVLDASDGCPDKAGPLANRGCPDTDRDGDTVADREDNCPDEPGPRENHGCAKKQKVVLSGDRLEILERVHFATASARIQARSYALLDNVATVLNAHPEIQKVIVEGHTDNRGNEARNLRLSQKRAEAVVQHLTRRGHVNPERLEARGFGSERPIVPNAQAKEDHQKNRRVEFRIPGDSKVAAPEAPAPAAEKAAP